jgi:hypothetical protein
MVRMDVAMQKNRYLNRYSVIFSLVCLLGSSPVVHAKLYKWVDAEGNTHYTQSPPPDGATTEDVKLPASVNIDNKEAVKAFEGQEMKKLEPSETKQKEEQEQIKKTENTELKKGNCKKARAKLENVQSAGRIRAVDENGNVTRATEEERQRRIIDAQGKIEKWCN